VTAGREVAARFAAALEAAFEEDGFPVASFEADEAADLWSVSVYVPQDEADATAARMAALLGGLEIGREPLGEVDWVTRTLEGLKPVREGRFLVHGSHDRAAARAGDHAILVDAAMAFGTGHHATTAGCLAAIGRALKSRRPRNALDLGTGTGVLAIAIAKSAAIPVLATDIDPVATRIAAQNCRLNGVAARVRCVTASGMGHREIDARVPFDLVVANILAGPLQAMARGIAGAVAPGGTLILSGLLARQRARILASYRLQGLVLEHSIVRDGWLTLTLRRPGP